MNMAVVKFELMNDLLCTFVVAIYPASFSSDANPFVFQKKAAVRLRRRSLWRMRSTRTKLLTAQGITRKFLLLG
jgi:hypothetical protein